MDREELIRNPDKATELQYGYGDKYKEQQPKVEPQPQKKNVFRKFMDYMDERRQKRQLHQVI